ncbi:uncharacterized protein AMSG_11492 [Thecamonas trahens ATCC 50062]|uniref:Uncharacterized protein n=1 Tax=Thecamonas trahens ATCC 50062 TaxID=461836 RepID=A0A0L0DVW2_THETB|nr:hypothetical protein AMSG_11492 [Thecamonas trahens ATCC 50062]KNC56216.1 hypothetical protein AMSG_11492 [Thecamonas trahens ATCC 50062]|eukprot:XP_013752662.1 hypothetical protein AMSG_11492 [Thecamonas trahens ATCC 50062]
MMLQMAQLSPPEWVGSAKAVVVDTPEWKHLKALVYDKLQTHLKASRLASFSELDDEAKLLFIQRIELELAAEPLYRQVAYRVANSVDAALSASAEAALRSLTSFGTSAYGTRSKTDALIDSASAALVSLLDKWPDQERNLGVLVNQRLVNPLRAFIWRRALIHPAAEREYELRVADSALATFAADDETVTLRVRELFVTVFPHLRVSVTQMTAMKTMISYYATRASGPVPESIYYLALPLVLVFEDALAARSASTAPLVGYLMRLAKMPRPRLVANSARKSERQASHQFAAQFSALLNAADPELHAALLAVFQSSADAGESTAATLATLLSQPVEHAFVGTTSMDVTLYIWDTCLLFGFDALYYFATVLVMLLRKGLLLCKSVTSLQRLIVDQAPTLSYTQFQSAIAQHFLPSLRAKLELPTLDSMRELAFATPSFASVLPDANLASSAGFWDAPLVPADVITLLAETMGPAVAAGRAFAGLTPDDAKAAMQARLDATTSATVHDVLGLAPSSPPQRRLPAPGQPARFDTDGRFLAPGMPGKRLPAARTAELMRKWRLMAWHAGIWASFLLGHKRYTPHAEPPAPRTLASTGGKPSTIAAGASVLLRPMLITHNRIVVKLAVPPIYPAVDRLSDTLDRLSEDPRNRGLFPANADERDDFVVAVEDRLFRYLPFMEDDTRLDILRIELPPRLDGSRPAIFLKPTPGRSGKYQVRAALRRNGLSLSLFPKIMGVYSQVTGLSQPDDHDIIPHSPRADDRLDVTDSLIPGIPASAAASAVRRSSQQRAQGPASLDSTPRYPRSPQAPGKHALSPPVAPDVDEYEYEYEYDDLSGALGGDGDAAEPDADVDPANAPGLTNLQKFFVGVVGSAMESVKLLALGDERDYSKLLATVQGKRDVRSRDLYDAEMAAFGKTLTQQEIARLPNKQLQVYNKKVLRRTHSKEDARYKEELRRRVERRRAADEAASLLGRDPLTLGTPLQSRKPTPAAAPSPTALPLAPADPTPPPPAADAAAAAATAATAVDDISPDAAPGDAAPGDDAEFEYAYEYEYDDELADASPLPPTQ